MFTADPGLEVCFRASSLLDADFYQLTDSVLVDAGKGVVLEEAVVEVFRQKPTAVVTRQAEGCLCEIIRTKGEKVGDMSNFMGCEGSSRKFNHGSDFERGVEGVTFQDILNDSF